MLLFPSVMASSPGQTYFFICAACPYGDKSRWCSGISPVQCYDIEDRCCETCKGLSTGIKGCVDSLSSSSSFWIGGTTLHEKSLTRFSRHFLTVNAHCACIFRYRCEWGDRIPNCTPDDCLYESPERIKATCCRTCSLHIQTTTAEVVTTTSPATTEHGTYPDPLTDEVDIDFSTVSPTVAVSSFKTTESTSAVQVKTTLPVTTPTPGQYFMTTNRLFNSVSIQYSNRSETQVVAIVLAVYSCIKNW